MVVGINPPQMGDKTTPNHHPRGGFVPLGGGFIPPFGGGGGLSPQRAGLSLQRGGFSPPLGILGGGILSPLFSDFVR